MKIKKEEIREFVSILGFKPQDGDKDIYYKCYPEHDNYVLKINFDKEIIEYGTKIQKGDATTSNFENSENFVVLECMNRVLEKGYPPQRISLEHKWPMGRREKGKLDILICDKDGKVYLMIECKTWGDEYDKEKKKMQRDGGQLFSYFQQDKSASYLCLYTSRLEKGKIEFSNDIVEVNEQWRELDNQKEIFDHWSKNFKDNGIFETWAKAYHVEIKALTRGRLKELTEEDSGLIFNQFAEILRHNVVSDKPNAFNKIFNLFLCKIVDENRKPTEEVKFQWLEDDTHETLQKRLSDLYKQGMKEYLTKEVTDYNDDQVAEKLFALEPEVRDQIKDMFTRVRLHKNNEFAFKEVFDEKSFLENAIVVREVVELLQPYQIRYGHKQQFLGDFFELLLSTGIKQEAGQFFTPVPIAKFIISSLPIRELIEKKIERNETNFLPYMIDYAAGSGHFLTEAMDEVQSIVESLDIENQRPSVASKIRSWKDSPFDWAYEYLYGIEADYRLVKTAKVSCFLNGDGLANMIHADGLDHFQKSTDYKGRLKEVTHEEKKDNGQFDILVANPPYSVSAFKNTLKFGEESFDLYPRLTDDSSEIECLFIERTKQLLKPGGWAGVILPSSILSNSGIYADAREIILKYFDIKGIAEFGSNTFMATNTNTVALFLQRRPNNEWKKIAQSIQSFFDNPKEAIVNGINKAFSKYVESVFEGRIEFSDYVTLINKKPNESLKTQEFFSNYESWFHGINEVKQLKDKKAFKDKTTSEKKAELEDLFYEKVFAREQDKLLYFFITYPQKTVLIKVGEKQTEKDFIGYEFSNRRGHEGIKMYSDENGKPTTRLYDDNNRFNPDKANSYIYSMFLGLTTENVTEELGQHIFYNKLSDMLDFVKIDFIKSIDITSQKKTKITSKFSLASLGSVTSGFTGIVFDKKDESQLETDLKILTASNIDLESGELSFDRSKFLKNNVLLDDNQRLKQGDIFVCTSSGSLNHLGKFVFIHEDIHYWPGGFCAILRGADFITQKYISIILDNYIEYRNYVEQFSGQNINNLKLSDLLTFQIPLPEKDVREKIVIAIETLEAKEKIAKDKINFTNEMIENILSAFREFKPIKEICSIKSDRVEPYTNPSEMLNYIGLENIESNTARIVHFSPTIANNIKSTKSVFKKGDVLYGKLRPYLNKVWIAEFDGVCSTDILVLETGQPILLKQLLLSKGFVSKSSSLMKGVHLPRLQVKDFMAFKVPYPELTKVGEIVCEIARLDNEIINAKLELETIDHEKEQILKNYLE